MMCCGDQMVSQKLCCFTKGLQDFSDQIWKNSIGRKEAAFFQKRALPLSLLAASALADLDLPKTSELVVHCILDGNVAPFSDPHDWSALVKYSNPFEC